MRPRIPRREKTMVRTYRQTAVNAVIVVVVLLLFVYVLIQFSRNFSSQVSTQRTQTVTDVTYSYLEGFVFTDGELLTEDGDIVHYLIPDGEKVGVGQAYAEIFSGTGLSAEECAERERRLNALSEQIALLENGIEHSKNASSLGSISDEIARSYYSYIDSVISGDLKAADKTGDLLFGALSDRSSVTLSEEAENTLSDLKQERDALISSIGGTKKTLISSKSFTFLHSHDGYESILNSSKLEGLTRDALDALVNEDADTQKGVIGSAVYSSKWYIAIPTDTSGYAEFKNGVGDTYSVDLLEEEDLTVDMLLEDVISADEDTSRSYLLFSSFDLSRAAAIGRAQSIRVRLGSCTGYRVPEDAMHRVGEDDGVYILVGNTVEFRRMTVIGRGDGYYIANTYENDLAEGAISDIPYLSANDLIVTSGRDLYDGKQLN